MASFDEAVKNILVIEGGFVDNPNDPGGATNHGISLRFLQTIKDYELGDIDNDGDIDYFDVAEMKVVEAKALYKKYWWDKYKYEDIPDQAVANKIFDMSVNMGARQAHRLLQRAINSTLGQIALVDDGFLGPMTSKGLQVALQQPLALLVGLRAHQAGFYRFLVAQDSKYEEFLKGWLNRAVS